MSLPVCYSMGTPWGNLKPPLSQKNHVATKIAHVAADISRVAADISHVAVYKAVEEAKSCWPKKFFSLF